jgi:hypothetical protein
MHPNFPKVPEALVGREEDQRLPVIPYVVRRKVDALPSLVVYAVMIVFWSFISITYQCYHLPNLDTADLKESS